MGTVANGRSGLCLHPQRWWSKESTINKRKMVWEEIHHLEEVTRIATPVGQKDKGNSAHGPSGRVQKTVLPHEATLSTWNPKIEFPYTGSLRRFTKTIQPSCLRVNYIRPIQSMWEKLPALNVFSLDANML